MKMLMTALVGIALAATPSLARAAMTDADLEAYILKNLPAGGDLNPQAVRAIGVGEFGTDLPEGLPENVRAALQGAIEEIEYREFEGTDYNAWVDGIYEVISGDELVGYAVQGYGTGEPDYNDGMTFGYNLGGGFVSYEENDW
jgi:hypothetical protein